MFQEPVLQVSQYGSTGTKFTVYGVTTDKFDPEDPEGTELAKGKLSASTRFVCSSRATSERRSGCI